MREIDFAKRYAFVLRWLQRRRAHVAAAVMRLGRMRLTEHVASAAVLVQRDQVWLYFNPVFCASLDHAELAGVLTHEALHFVFAHQRRVAAIHDPQDRFCFQLACEAVVNDIILASFKELKLPGHPVTGPWLVGCDTSQLSAEHVMQLLWSERMRGGERLRLRLAPALTLDDHSVWEPGEPAPPAEDAAVDADADATPPPTAADWTGASDDLVRALLEAVPRTDPCYGTVAAGTRRPAPPALLCRKNLARFLEDAVSRGPGYDTLWTVPNRKLGSLYPRVILPTYDPQPWRDVLVAIDTSGSVPPRFLAVAMAFARQRRLRTRLTLVSFDTVCYPANLHDATLRGAGGTRVQAVEEYIRAEMRQYPDIVFLLTDGWTPPPEPRYPERWIWLLPPWGSVAAVPRGSAAEFFAAEEMAAVGMPVGIQR